ncbi:MAG: hypothetical protein ACOY45_03255 [Pseudomonadota bacterium]
MSGGVSLQNYTVIGPMRVRLAGVTRADDKGLPVASVNAPTEGEAMAALHRAARVVGAEQVLQASSDYRRAAIAAGLGVRIEVEAHGIAVRRHAQEPPVAPSGPDVTDSGSAANA